MDLFLGFFVYFVSFQTVKIRILSGNLKMDRIYIGLMCMCNASLFFVLRSVSWNVG